MKKRIIVFIAALVLISAAACTPVQKPSEPTSVPTSSSVSSIPAPVVSTPSVPSESSSAPVESSETPVNTDIDTAEIAADIRGIADTLRREGRLSALILSDRLTAAAEYSAEAIVAGGRSFIRNSDFRTLPDGTRLTSVVNSIESTEGILYNIDYSIWVMTNVEDAQDAHALYSDVINSDRFSDKTMSSNNRVGIGVCCAEGGPMVVVIYYSAPTAD